MIKIISLQFATTPKTKLQMGRTKLHFFEKKIKVTKTKYKTTKYKIWTTSLICSKIWPSLHWQANNYSSFLQKQERGTPWALARRCAPAIEELLQREWLRRLAALQKRRTVLVEVPCHPTIQLHPPRRHGAT